MATGQLEGASYSLIDEIVRFFDYRGSVIDDGFWTINVHGGPTLVKVRPDSIMPNVRRCIEVDVSAGSGDRIAQLQLGPMQAVVFYLEGKITRRHLLKAIEGDGFIDIPGVEVEGRKLTVRVVKKPEHNVATADAEGNVL